MRTSLSIFLLCGAALHAQDGPQRAIHPLHLDLHGPLEMDAKPVIGLPYSAQVSTERVQLLPDGNRIVQNSTGSVARDGKGRVLRKQSLSLGVPGEEGDLPSMAFLDDPVADVHLTVDENTKIATEGGHREVRIMKDAVRSSHSSESGTEESSDKNVTRSDLGTQAMEGLQVQGKRITRTILAGAVGNDLPLNIVTETWYSPELKVLVMSKTEDPRMGTTTYRLKDIKRGEPPASLFDAPADLKIKGHPGDVLFIHKNPTQ